MIFLFVIAFSFPLASFQLSALANSSLTGSIDHICIKTADVSWGGTDDDVSLTIYGSNTYCKTSTLDGHGNAFESNDYDCYYGTADGLGGCYHADIGSINSVKAHTAGTDGWFCDYIKCYISDWVE